MDGKYFVLSARLLFMNKRERIGTHVKEEKNCVRFCGSETDILHRARNKLLWTSIFWTSLLALQRIMHMLWLFARRLLYMYLYCTAQPPLMAAGKCRHATWVDFFPSPPVTVGKASRRRWGEEDFFLVATYVRSDDASVFNKSNDVGGKKGLNLVSANGISVGKPKRSKEIKARKPCYITPERSVRSPSSPPLFQWEIPQQKSHLKMGIQEPESSGRCVQHRNWRPVGEGGKKPWKKRHCARE